MKQITLNSGQETKSFPESIEGYRLAGEWMLSRLEQQSKSDSEPWEVSIVAIDNNIRLSARDAA